LFHVGIVRVVVVGVADIQIRVPHGGIGTGICRFRLITIACTRYSGKNRGGSGNGCE
jgi:hypothetical protein